MVDVIQSFRYKTAGRGRGVLGLSDVISSRRPGEKMAPLPATSETPDTSARSSSAAITAERASRKTDEGGDAGKKENSSRSGGGGAVIVVLYDYIADPSSPGGFTELNIKAGQILEYQGEQKNNEHWWRVRDEDGNTGCVPASYVIKKEAQALPWLELAALNEERTERKERVKRLLQQKAADEGKGFGPVPKSVPKPYVSTYNKSGAISAPGGKQYYCEVCEKQLNGPKPYQAHMASKSHREELALLEN